MRNVLLFSLLLFAGALFGQTTTVERLNVKLEFRLGTPYASVTSISVDTTLAGATDLQLVTARVVKIYASKLGGRPVSTALPASGQVMQWNGAAWVPATVSGGGGGYTAIYQEFVAFTGTTITPTGTIPATDREWKIELYRTGIRMTYLKDFTVSSGNIVLVLAASSEDFVLILH